jgi:hypothetical protein
MTKLPVLGCALAGLAASASALAGDETPQRKAVELSAGARVAAGGNLFTTPGEIPGNYEGLGFAGDAGGFGWGAFAYGEARFFRHLGLELTLGHDSSALQREVTYNQLVKVKEKLQIGTTRLGFLAKGVLDAPFGRLWLGLGPELVLGVSADATNEVVSGQQYVPDPAALDALIHPAEEKSTLLAFGLGLVFHAGSVAEIPFDLRAAKNLSQDDAWADRVTLHQNGNYDVKTQSSWEFRMGTGLGARF